MEELLEFLNSKANEAISEKIRYQDSDCPFEQVSYKEAKKAIDNYAMAIGIIKAYHGYIKDEKTPLKQKKQEA